MRRILPLLLIGILTVPFLATAAQTQSSKAVLADEYGTDVPGTAYSPGLPHELGWNCNGDAYPPFVGGSIENGVCLVVKAAGYSQGSGAAPIKVGGYPVGTPYTCFLSVTDVDEADGVLLAAAEWKVRFPNAVGVSVASTTVSGETAISGKVPGSWSTGKRELVTDVQNLAAYTVTCTFSF